MIIFNNNSIGYVLDVDASKVIEAVRSTGVTITPAMMHYAHYLISNMKNIGTWQLSNAVYGFVGGTAASHKWNWKDLRDVDAAFRLTYSGGVTHSANGIKYNGTTGYANTFLKLSSNISATGLVSFGMYTNSTTTAINGYDIGAYGTIGYTVLNIAPTFVNFLSPFASGNSQLNVIRNFSKGFYQTTQNGSINGYINGQKQTGTLSYPANQIININIYLGAANNNNANVTSYTDKQHCFDFFSAPLTDTQAQQQSQIVTNAQNILNRA